MDDVFSVPGPWEGRFVAANGARFYVVEAGSGPTVVLVHGYPGFWWSWRHQLPALAAAGYHAVAVDVRGFGGSDKPPHGYDLDTCAADLVALVRSLGAERAVFVGQGMGAWTCRYLPGLHPDVTAGIALVAMPHPRTRHGRVRPLPPRRLDRYRRALRAQFLRTRGSGAATQAAADLAALLRDASGTSATWVTPEVIERYAAALAQPFVAPAAVASFDRLRPNWRERRRLAVVAAAGHAPTLIVHGQNDPVATGESALEIARSIGGRLRLESTPGAGHFVAEEAPDAVNAILIDWLNGLGLPPR